MKLDNEDSFAGFQAEIKKFDAWIESQLNADQQRRLESALSRRRILELGIKKFLHASKDRLGLTSAEISLIFSELASVAREHVAEGNQLCCNGLAGLPWDYIDSDLAQTKNLPPIPISFLVKRIELADGSQQRNLIGVEENALDFESSVWFFEGPTYQRRGDGMIEFSKYVNPFPRQRTPLSLLYDMTGLEFSARQSEAVYQCMIDTNEKNGFEPSGDSKKYRKEILSFEQSKWDLATRQLLPVQTEPAHNLVRLHSCFTIGPSLIASDLLSGKKVDPKFGEKLNELREELVYFSQKAEKDIASKLLTLIKKHGDEDLDINIEDFHIDKAGFYESLVISILEPSVHGK